MKHLILASTNATAFTPDPVAVNLYTAKALEGKQQMKAHAIDNPLTV